MQTSIASSGRLGWRELSRESGFAMSFRTEEAGFVEIDLLARAESDWRVNDCESAALRIYVQEEYNQDCILFYGNRPLTYSRLLGCFAPGSYTLRCEFNGEIASPGVRRAFIESVEVRLTTRDSPMFPIYRHAPVLYGRNVYHPYENRYTDTPMLMFYLTEERSDETVIEYQMMFSHEDEGTPTPLLMSKWGRTTDIEWVYRVVLDREGEVRSAVFQGPEHRTTHFRGNHALGGHPVLQSATTNGMVSDVVTSNYRFLFPPIRRWNPQEEPRERVMDAFPYTYQVTAWEMLRQFPMEEPAIANSYQLADLRNYLYVQTEKRTADPRRKTSIDIQVKLKGLDCWFSSSHGDLRHGNFRCAYDGPYSQFSTTVKLPPGTGYADIEQICAVWLPGGEDRVVVPGFKAFFLDDDYLPQPALRADAQVTVTKERPRQILWSGSGAE